MLYFEHPIVDWWLNRASVLKLDNFDHAGPNYGKVAAERIGHR